MIKRTLILAAFATTAMASGAQEIYFPFDGNTTESVSKTGTMNGVRTLPYADGVKGQCVRLDGYSNYISSTPSYTGLTPASMTFSLWIAPETYPMMDAGSAQVTPTYAMVAGNMDETAKTGFGLYLNSQGGYEVKCVVSSQVREYKVTGDIIPLGQWSNIVVTFDNASQQLHVYRNGIDRNAAMANGRNTYRTAPMGTASFLIGKSREELWESGMFNINTFNGLIDEVRASNGVKTAADIEKEYNAVNVSPINSIDINSLLTDTDYGYLRPQFHGMPAKGWTNESHGMVYYNGKYHVFFQKNGNGPYMARLHWGHITSTDLLNWQEEPVAIAPGASANNLEANDGKGCWSGCVFTDPDFNGGKPTILYTGVSNAKAYIWMASPKDDDLITWEKTPGQIIASGGNPCTVDASDDFRDPYFFTVGGNKYIIIGTSNTVHVGTCLLYKYTAATGSWDYQGLFFSGTSQAVCGRFWEMPNVTDLGNGKFLFTCTPLDTGSGVKTLYWIGTIGADGRFTPDQQNPQQFEADGTSKDGYGLLSPTIYNDNGTLLALGIVPDKVATDVNYNWGWAHNYSLPRELTLSTDGKSIVEKPLSTVANYRQSGYRVASGRQIEMKGTFTSSSDAQGFRFLKNGDNYAQLSVAGGKLTLDLTHMQRTVNDGVYGGIYETAIPATEAVTVDAVLDGSIIDIFFSSPSAEGKAFSVRLFPADKNALGCESFTSTGSAQVGTNVNIWAIDSQNPTGIHQVSVNNEQLTVNNDACYNLLGQQISSSTKGIFIMGGRKYVRH